MLGRVHQDHAILVEQTLVAFDGDGEFAAVLERDPGGAVRQNIGVAGRRSVERRAHALTDRLVPGALVLIDVDAGNLPEREFGAVGAGLVAARDKRRAFVLDQFEGGGDVLAALDAGRVALRSDQHEVVVHDREALHAEAIGDKFFFLRLGMHEHNVGVAAAAGIERLAGALRHDLHLDAGLGLEHRQDMAEQTGVLRRRGRRDHDGLVLRLRRRGDCHGAEREGGHQSATIEHVILHPGF